METRNGERKGGTSEHDRGYKRLFSHPTAVEELLCGFLQEDWAEHLDFSTLERVGNSFVSEDFRERHGDLLWRLRFKGKDGWFYLYLLLEFQSTSDPFMAVRLLTYVSLLLEQIIRKGDLKPGDGLPAVLPLVLHNGKRPWRAPRDLESLFVEVPEGLRRYLPRLTYLLLDEGRLDLDRPGLERNQIAALFRIETSKSLEDFRRLTRELAGLIAGGGDPELRRTLDAWVLSLFRRTFPGAIISETTDLEEIGMLEETAVEWRRQWKREARREGLQEGRKEGLKEGVVAMRKLLLQQMTQRFGRLPVQVRRRVEEISSIAELSKLGKKLLSAESLRDLGLA